jgi:Cdc6-like AAA superfamily ATPase
VRSDGNDFSPVIRPEFFYGRDEELERIIRACATGTERAEPTSILIVGELGIGKTSLAFQAARALEEHFPDGVLHVNENLFQDRGDGRVDAICRYVLSSLNEVHEWWQPDSVETGRDKSLRAYHKVLNTSHMLLILDDISRVDEILELLPKSGVSALIAISNTWPAHPDRFGEVIELGALSQSSAYTLIRDVTGSTTRAAEILNLIDQNPTLANPRTLKLLMSGSRSANLPDSVTALSADTRIDVLGEVVERAILQLEPAAAQTVALLSLFGEIPFSLGQAVEVVGGDRSSIASQLSDLMRRGLLSQVSDIEFQMHSMVASFGNSRLRDLDEDRVRFASEAAVRTIARKRLRSRVQIVRDIWTVHDSLNYENHARAVSAFIQHPSTRGPLSIGILGAWGMGKTSFMRMVQQRLDPPDETDADGLVPSALVLSVRGPRADRSNAVHRQPRRRKRTTLATPRWRTIDIVRASGQVERRTPKQLDAKKSFSAETATKDSDWRPTVWFNPWKYENSEQVWAGLAHELVSQVTARLSSRDRHSFWVALNLRRFDPARIRQYVQREVISRVAPWLVATIVLAALAVLVALTGRAWSSVAPSVATAVSVGASSLVGFSVLLTFINVVRTLLADSRQTLTSLGMPGIEAAQSIQIMRKSAIAAASAAFIDPSYESRLGYLDLVHSDVRNVLRLVASEDRPLTVFVDDLDRCSPGTVSTVIEAINQFLGGDFRDSIFVLGLDARTVAGHVEATYKDVLPYMAGSDRASGGSTFGWRFLDKFVQLPLPLPRPTWQVLRHGYVDALIGKHVMHGSKNEQVSSVVVAASAGRVSDSVKEISASRRSDPLVVNTGEGSKADIIAKLELAITLRAPTIDDLAEAARSAEIEIFGSSSTALRPETMEAATRIFGEVYSDGFSAPAIRHGLDLLQTGNPRQIKRFLNLFRFYLFIDQQRSLAGMASATPAEIAKISALVVRYPQLLAALLASSGPSSILACLEELIPKYIADGSNEMALRPDLEQQWMSLLREYNLGDLISSETDPALAREFFRFVSSSPRISRVVDEFL